MVLGMRFTPEEHRFLRLAAGIWVAMQVGVPFAFGILTNDMKEQFKLSQGDLSTIGTFGTIMGCFSLPAGIMWDRVGPKPILVCGGVCVSLGFILLFLAFNGSIPGNMGTLLVIQFFLTIASGWMDIASLMTNLFSFPLNNGDVVILQKTFMGLGSAMVASFYSGWFDKNIKGYCLFMAGYSALALTVGFFIIDLPKYVYRKREELKQEEATTVDDESHERKKLVTGKSKVCDGDEDEVAETTHLLHITADRRRIRIGFFLLGLLILHLTATAVIDAYVKIAPITRSVFAGVTLLLGFSFYVLPFIKTNKATLEEAELHSGKNLTEGEEDAHNKQAESLATPTVQYETTFWQSWKKPDLWLMWWYSFCVWGAGSCIISNSSVVYKALNNNVYNNEDNALFVAFLGLGSAGGRIVCGLLDQKWVNPNGKPVTILYPVPPILSAVGLVGFLVLPVKALMVPYAIFGAGFGWSWATTVLTARRFFKYDLGTHYNFIFTAPMAAALVFNRGIFGTIYDHYAAQQGRTINCAGSVCVLGSLLAMAGFCVTAIGAALLVHRRWSRYLEERSLEDANNEA